MMRRFVFLGTLLASTTLAATASGQSSGTGMSLAERMAALRRGWSADKPDGEQERGERSQRASDEADNEGRSLLPDWFGWRGEEPPRQATGRTASRGGRTQRVASRPRTGSVQQPQETLSPAALPGLGGSPLPQGQWSPGRGKSTVQAPVAPEIATDYPVIRGNAPERTKTQRQRSSGTSAAESPTRHSPGRRTAPHLDPEEMRRELAGTIPENSNRISPRVAQAEERRAREAAPLVLPATEADAPARRINQFEAFTMEPAAAKGGVESPPRRSAAEAFGEAREPSDSTGPSSFARSPQSMTNGVEVRGEVRKDLGKPAFGEALHVANGGDPNVLVSNQAPTITADIRGPKQILVGREATYRVRLQNQGGAAAEEIVASVRIPSWADIVDTSATKGAVRPSQGAAAPSQLEWQIARLDGKATETLDIRLIPRESRPLELGISWTVAPTGSRAIVEVQEPKLQVAVEGPNEVLYGSPQVFKLTLSNPGTGLAENVKIVLVPPGSDEESATSHPLGNLQPGESKTVEIELTAREAGKLQVKAIASAEGGLAANVAKDVFCRKPELEVDWRGPATKYAGTPTTYYFRVRNPGTAPAEDVTVQVTLPEGAEFTSASEGQTFDATRRQVSWPVGTLAPGDDNYMEIRCIVKKPGINQFRVDAATAAGDLADSATAETSVVALADLKLEVSDPSRPVAVGSPALYEIRIMNRGASAAKNVNVAALFSEGIEPDEAEGAEYSIADGRVSFRPIDELPPGQQVTLRIKAHARSAGTHVFRAEVLCRESEIKLAAEETTRFYADEVLSEGESDDSQAASGDGFRAAAAR